VKGYVVNLSTHDKNEKSWSCVYIGKLGDFIITVHIHVPQKIRQTRRGGAENAGVENAGVEKAGVDSRGRKCWSGKCGSR